MNWNTKQAFRYNLTPAEQFPELWRRVQRLNLGVHNDMSLIETIETLTNELLTIHRIIDTSPTLTIVENDDE